MKKIFMIGNTHFDPVWLWRWDEAMSSIHSTFKSALDRMDEDTDFIYSFATPPVFEWIKEIDPEMFEKIKKRVAEGRWELCEGMWLQPDCYSASGESYARQAMYGQRYLKENFGFYTDSVFNIDSFGHSLQLVQILKKSHVENYVLCRPEQKHVSIPVPYFYWQSKDGSRLRAFRAGQISKIYNKDMEKNVNLAKETDGCDEMMVYGVTNHGGAPTKKAIADIHRLNSPDCELIFSTVSDFFKNQGEPTLTVDYELITGDFGPYVNNHKIKRLNRLAEYAVLNAEKASVIAKTLLSRAYPQEKLTECWKDIMFCQFHDILGGASIKDAYFDAYNQLGRAITTATEVTQFALQSITKQIKIQRAAPWSIVVWNLKEQPFDGYIEAEVQWLHEFDAYEDGIELVDGDGKVYPCQIILEKSVIKGFRSRFVFKADISAFGYKVFSVRKTNSKVSRVKNPDITHISTKNFDADFENGVIRRVKSKTTGKCFENVFTPVCYTDGGDTWCFNIDGYGKTPMTPEFESICVTENGIHRTTLKADFVYNDSRISLYYTFYNDADYFDIRYSVNWNEKHTVLKLELKSDLKNLAASAPFAIENRADSGRDMPMGEWLTLSGDDCTMNIITNSIFGYNNTDGKLGLTLLRSCIYGDLRLCELDDTADYPIMEQGVCEGALRIKVADKNRCISADAAQFNDPPIVITDCCHDGYLPLCDSFIDIDSENVAISTVKKCEDDDGIVIRLCEYEGKTQALTLRVFGTSFKTDISPFEIKTLKIKDNSITEVNITED